MIVPYNYTVYIYMFIIILGAVRTTILIMDSFNKKKPFYIEWIIFYTSLFAYLIFVFLYTIFLFANESNAYLYRLSVFGADVTYFVMICYWIILLGRYIEAKRVMKDSTVKLITIIYGICVEIFIYLHIVGGKIFNLSLSQLNFSNRLVKGANLLYGSWVIVIGIYYAVCALKTVSKSRSRYTIFLSGLLLSLYILYEMQWTVFSSLEIPEGKRIMVRFEMLFIAYLIECILSLKSYLGKVAGERMIKKPDPESQKNNSAALPYEKNKPEPDLFEQFSLTKREREIAELILQGNSNPDIAKTLYISENTVKRHVNNIYQKTGVKNRYELIALRLIH